MDRDLRRFLLLVVMFGVIAGLIVGLSYSAGNYAGRDEKRRQLMNDDSTVYAMSIDGCALCFSGSIWWPARLGGACFTADAPK